MAAITKGIVSFAFAPSFDGGWNGIVAEVVSKRDLPTKKANLVGRPFDEAISLRVIERL
jgi:hypothetical protein